MNENHALALSGPICAFLSSFLWAVGSVRYATLAQRYSPFAVNSGRALVAMPFFVFTVFAVAGGVRPGVELYSQTPIAVLGWVFLSTVSSFALGDALFLRAAGQLGAPAALAIASMYPLWTALIAALWDGQHLNTYQLAGLLLTIGGVVAVIISGKEKGTAATRRGLTAGVALAFIVSVFWALNGYALSHAGALVHPAVASSWRMLFSFVTALTLGVLLNRKQNPVLPKAELKRQFPLFVFEAFGGSMCFIWGMTHTTLAVASVLSSLAPVLSVPIAWASGTEKFSWMRTVGVLVVGLGLWVLTSG